MMRKVSLALAMGFGLALAGPAESQERLYPGVYIQEHAEVKVRIPSGGSDHLLGVEIPGQALRGERVRVVLHPARGAPVRAFGMLKERATGGAGRATAPSGDVLIGKITPKGESDAGDPTVRLRLSASEPARYDARLRAVVAPLASPYESLLIVIGLPPRVLEELERPEVHR